MNQTKESNFQNKVYTIPHTAASAFISDHVHSTIIAVYKITRNILAIHNNFLKD